MNLASVKRREVLRYMGCKGEVPREVWDLAEECLAMLGNVCSPKHVVREFPLILGPEGQVETECFQTVSKNLAKNLKDCRCVLVFAATLGLGADQLIRRYSRLDMSKAVALQAGAAAMLEEYCDQVCRGLRDTYLEKGFYLRPRFSPGYGDFSLDCQPGILQALEAGKRVGITLTDGFLMLPTKSVTAVMGIGETPVNCQVQGCEACGKRDCAYRRAAGPEG